MKTIPEYPDEALNPLQLSLSDYVAIAQGLFPSGLKPDQDPYAFIQFVLAGRLHYATRDFRVFINAKQNALPPPSGKYQLFGDLDSVIGLTRDLPFNQPFAVFPLPYLRDTLTEDNHVKYKIPGGFKDAFGVSLHKIPNMPLGKAGQRQVTRIFFPRLYTKDKSPSISSETRKLVYEKCLRPAAVKVNCVDQSRWPINYTVLMRHCRDKKGKLHFGSIDFPARLTRKLGAKLLELCEKHDDLKDAFFVHELRGTKSSSHHDPKNADDRRAAVGDVFAVFDAQINPDQWVVDIGLEIRQEGRVLQWLTEGHQRIMAYLLPSASEERISDILNSQTQYHCDISAQLPELGGFRASPGARGKADQVSYINVYTTDKSATYQLHDGIFRRRKPWHLFPSNITQLINDLENIGETFRSCAGDDTDGLEGNARMEIRVPLKLADAVLVDLPYDVVEAAVASFSCKTFWMFKFYRLAALSYIVKSLKNDDASTRLRNEYLSMGAITIYMVNAIIYRPAEGRGEKVLLEAACQHVMDESGFSHPNLYGQGCYFLSDVAKTNVSYHLPIVRPIDSEFLEILYRRDSIEDISAEFHIPHKRSQAHIQGVYPSKRQKLTTKIKVKYRCDGTLWSGDDMDTESTDSTDMESDVENIQDEDSDTANDEDKESEDRNGQPSKDPVVPHSHPPRHTSGTEAKAALSKEEKEAIIGILHQFPADIFELIPRPRKGDTTPWILPDLNPEQLEKIGLFKSFKFRSLFRMVQYKIVDDGAWENLLFDRYFPPKGARVGGLQGFPKARYYQRWVALLGSVDTSHAQEIRILVLKWFHKLWWLPFPEADRMWNTAMPPQSNSQHRWIMVPPGDPQICPRLAINPVHWEAKRSEKDVDVEAREIIDQGMDYLSDLSE